MNKFIILAMALATTSSAFALKIDDFQSGAHSATLTTAHAADVHWASTPGATGGIRMTFAYLETNPTGGAMDLRVSVSDPCMSGSSTVGGVQGFYQLGYGFRDRDNMAGTLPLNLDLRQDRNLVVDFLSNSDDLGLDVYVTRRAESAYDQSIIRNVVPGGHLSPFSFAISLTSLSHLEDVDSILFNITSAPRASFAISGVEAVPEPSSLLGLAGLGCAVLRFSRRRIDRS